MTALARVIRNTPSRGLQVYFDQKGLFFGGMRPKGVALSTTTLLQAVTKLGDSELAVITADFERLQEMTDESGQLAIQHALTDPRLLDGLSNQYERAMWLFLNDHDAFRRAEEMRYTDTRRQGRMWSGFVGPSALVPSQEPEDHRQFEIRVCSLFGSRNAKLDLFERTRMGQDNRTERVVQAVIYRDGLPDASLEFNAAGELELHPHRPVYEVAITYEPASGVIEVVAQGVEQRARLARMFAEVILRQNILGLRIPLRQYDLSHLLAPFDFPSDPEDGIDAVKVTWLKLRHHESEQSCMALIADWRNRSTIHDHARNLNPAAGSLSEQFEVDEATISVRLRPARGSSGRRRTINVTITLPNGCNLKSQTEKERLICDRYLPRWGLVKEI